MTEIQPQQKKKTSGIAIASFLCSIFFVISILGRLFGIPFWIIGISGVI